MKLKIIKQLFYNIKMCTVEYHMATINNVKLNDIKSYLITKLNEIGYNF